MLFILFFYEFLFSTFSSFFFPENTLDFLFSFMLGLPIWDFLIWELFLFRLLFTLSILFLVSLLLLCSPLVLVYLGRILEPILLDEIFIEDFLFSFVFLFFINYSLFKMDCFFSLELDKGGFTFIFIFEFVPKVSYFWFDKWDNSFFNSITLYCWSFASQFFSFIHSISYKFVGYLSLFAQTLYKALIWIKKLESSIFFVDFDYIDIILLLLYFFCKSLIFSNNWLWLCSTTLKILLHTLYSVPLKNSRILFI